MSSITFFFGWKPRIRIFFQLADLLNSQQIMFELKKLSSIKKHCCRHFMDSINDSASAAAGEKAKWRGTCADKLSVLCKLPGFSKVIFYVRPLLVPSLMSRRGSYGKGVVCLLVKRAGRKPRFRLCGRCNILSVCVRWNLFEWGRKRRN